MACATAAVHVHECEKQDNEGDGFIEEFGVGVNVHKRYIQ